MIIVPERKSNTILGKPVPASPPDTSPLNSSMVILAGQNVEKFNKNGYQWQIPNISNIFGFHFHWSFGMDGIKMSFQDSCLLSSVFDLYLSVSFYPISLSLYSRPFKNCDPDKEQTAFYSSFRASSCFGLAWKFMSRSARTTSRANTKSWGTRASAQTKSSSEASGWHEAFLASVYINHFSCCFLVVFLGFLMVFLKFS